MTRMSQEKHQSYIRMRKVELEISKAVASKGTGCTNLEIVAALQSQLNNWIEKARDVEIENEEAHNSLLESVAGHVWSKGKVKFCVHDSHYMNTVQAQSCWKADYNHFMKDSR